MMLSESQERMLMVLRPELEAQAKAVFDKWDLDFAIVGETIAEDRFLIRLHGEIKADLPLKALSGNAPEYDRPWVETSPAAPLTNIPTIDPIEGLKALLASPNYASKAWVYEQYDTMVMGDTARTPGWGAGIIRIHGTDKSLAFTSDVTPRYVHANPFEGGKQAVAEAYRNLTAVGATPLATTDNLNFGNPEKPVIMGQFVGAVKGIGEAVAALGMPIVSGNVSLYNETDGSAILPTPTIGAVGILRSSSDIIGFKIEAGYIALLLGTTRGHLGQSALMAEAYHRAEGDAPPVDLTAEAAHGDFIRAHHAHIAACTDLSDGGLALAAFEMAHHANLGLSIDTADTAQLFGEDQARYLIACMPAHATQLLAAAKAANIPLRAIGTLGGDTLAFGTASSPLSDLATLYRNSFAQAIA
jgi:phosphoribosylformylglycinamidine synthase